MDAKLIQTIQQDSVKDERPEITTGMEVEVHQIIKEGNKERIQKFKGLVIKTHGKTTLDKTITVRKDVDGVGIEKNFPNLLSRSFKKSKFFDHSRFDEAILLSSEN